jgi:hypothetical protein
VGTGERFAPEELVILEYHQVAVRHVRAPTLSRRALRAPGCIAIGFRQEPKSRGRRARRNRRRTVARPCRKGTPRFPPPSSRCQKKDGTDE